MCEFIKWVEITIKNAFSIDILFNAINFFGNVRGLFKLYFYLLEIAFSSMMLKGTVKKATRTTIHNKHQENE